MASNLILGLNMIIIRPITPQDKPQWSVLWQSYLEFYKTTLPLEVYEAAFSRLLDDTSTQFCFVAEKEGKLLGLVHYIFHKSMWTVNDYVYLQDLFVSNEARGEGLGRLLIEAVYAEAKAKGANRVHWLTHEGNETARLLYDRLAENLGFIQYRKIL